jgi:hypothetical protein
MSLEDKLEEELPDGHRSKLRTAGEVLSGESGFAQATETAIEAGFYGDGEELNEADYSARELAADTVSNMYDRAKEVAARAASAVDVADNPQERKSLRKLRFKAQKVTDDIEGAFPEEVYMDAEVPVQPYRASD